MNRRTFLKLSLQAAVGITVLQTVPAWASSGERSLSFYHTHTGEHLDVTFARWGKYDPRALESVNAYLRDFRTGEEHRIDPGVLDILWKIQQEMGCRGTYEVISGYRSPATNQALRRKSKGVAKHSMHTLGKAIDIRLSGQHTCQIRDCAIALKGGGVGYYAKSDFVHIDTGRVRTW
ncbi:MAG: Twin-arginine translocation pathway signal [Desulfobulbus sp.]|nr:MAG: Twin-arginine translocation pathway signal [Desulfobulbus sp.]